MTLGLFELTAIAAARPLALVESWSIGLGPIGAKPYRSGSLFRTPPARNGLLRRLRSGAGAPTSGSMDGLTTAPGKRFHCSRASRRRRQTIFIAGGRRVRSEVHLGLDDERDELLLFRRDEGLPDLSPLAAMDHARAADHR